jgi:pentatricopeptide repeat protein
MKNFKTDFEIKFFNRHFRLDAFFLLNTLIKALSKKGKLSKARKIVANISYLIKIENQNFSFIFLHQAFSYIRPLIGFKAHNNLKFNQKAQIIPLTLAQSYRLAIR